MSIFRNNIFAIATVPSAVACNTSAEVVQVRAVGAPELVNGMWQHAVRIRAMSTPRFECCILGKRAEPGAHAHVVFTAAHHSVGSHQPYVKPGDKTINLTFTNDSSMSWSLKATETRITGDVGSGDGKQLLGELIGATSARVPPHCNPMVPLAVACAFKLLDASVPRNPPEM